MPLVANGIVRYTISGTVNDGSTWANIWDVWLGGVADADRPARAATYAGLLLDAWDQNLASQFSSFVTVTEVSWVDLDTAEGSTGATTVGINTTPPYQGNSTGTTASANVAILVTKQGSSQRGSRNGRMYVPGIREEDTNGDTISSGPHVALQEKYDLFLGDLTEPAGIPEEGVWPVIVHTRNIGTPTNPEIVFVDSSQVTALQVQSRLATQRRRLRR